MFKNCLLLFAASITGSIYGFFLAIIVITGFTQMILNSIFNLYYSTLFFIVGSYYTYKIFKKSKIQMSLDTEGFTFTKADG